MTKLHMNTTQARTLINYIKSIRGYFEGTQPMPRDMIDERIKYLNDYLGGWVDISADPVLKYSLNVLEDWYKGQHAAYITSMVNASVTIESRTVQLIEELLQ